MFEYISSDGTRIRVGETSAENDRVTFSSSPESWWVVVCADVVFVFEFQNEC